MKPRIWIGIILLLSLIAVTPYYLPQAYLSKFTEGGIVGKIIMAQTGQKVFEIKVEERVFKVAITGEGVKDLVFNQEERAIALGNDGSSGLLEVEIPKELLGGEFTVSADGKPIEFDLSENEEDSILLFKKPTESNEIVIQGTTVVPEFPAAMIVLAGLVASALMMVRARNLRVNRGG